MNHRHIYYLTPVTNFGHLGYFQGCLFNTTRRFSRLLHAVNYNNCTVRIVCLNMAWKAEICTRNKAINISVINECVFCWLHHSLKVEYAVKCNTKLILIFLLD
jgi:hypothetical protein